MGPDVVTPTIDEVMDALERMPTELSWPTAAERVVPLLARVRPYPPEAPLPLQTVLAPGISVGFGVDIGPAFINLSAEMLADWAVPIHELTARALGNLHRRTARLGPQDVLALELAGVPAQMLQADAGVASGLILEPTQLDRLFGPGRRLYLAPMRSVLIGLPAEVDRELAAWIFAEIAAQDPNCLAPLAFLKGGSTLIIEPLGAAFGSA